MLFHMSVPNTGLAVIEIQSQNNGLPRSVIQRNLLCSITPSQKLAEKPPRAELR